MSRRSRRFMHGRFVADVNVQEPGPDGATSRRDETSSARTLHRGCQRVGPGCGDAMGRQGDELCRNASSQMSTCREWLRRRDESP
jgi:hypothetical protein